jgi:hypothetical protein
VRILALCGFTRWDGSSPVSVSLPHMVVCCSKFCTQIQQQQLAAPTKYFGSTSAQGCCSFWAPNVPVLTSSLQDAAQHAGVCLAAAVGLPHDTKNTTLESQHVIVSPFLCRTQRSMQESASLRQLASLMIQKTTILVSQLSCYCLSFLMQDAAQHARVSFAAAAGLPK